MQNCMMCKGSLEQDDEAGMCKKCMYQVWGPKMSEHIRNSFREARKNGTLLNN